MEITIKLGGPLRKKIEGHVRGELKLALPDGSRVSGALTALGLAGGEVRMLMLNGRSIRNDQTLNDGDRLALFPPELAYNAIAAISFFNPLARETEKKG